MPAPVNAPMPEDLDVGGNYTIRVTAVDPTSGAVVSTVNIQTTVLTAQAEDDASIGGGSDLGQWLLVPGPGA